MKCHCQESCIKNKDELLEQMADLYKPCDDCTTRKLKKSLPLTRQIKLEKIDKNYGLCPTCKKRNIDYVMAHILKILIDNAFQNDMSSIRKVGTPLITPGIFLERQPFLSEDTLVILLREIDEKTAQLIINEVPEVKGVLKGDINDTVGQITENDSVNNYQLISGCDLRCDLQNSDSGVICIYKQQSKIHIEYPKLESPKIIQLSKVLDEYENPTVVDAMCGPGTLGIYALFKNAEKVIFNDINKDAIDNLKFNLEMNNISSNQYELYNKNIFDLVKLDISYDIGIIDSFPGVNTENYEKELKKICKRVIII